MQSNTKINEGYSSPEIKTSENIIQNLPLKSLVPMELSVRLTIDEVEIEALAESVKIHGVLEPLLVRPSHTKKGKFEIVCGMRRFVAAQKAELDSVPCIIREMDDREAMEAVLVENIDREDLSDYEIGRWFKLMLDKNYYLSQEALGKRFGYSQDMVSLLIRHYKTIEEWRAILQPNITTRVVTLPEGVVREIRRAPEACQPKLIEYAIKYGRNVRDVAKIVDVLLKTPEDLHEKVLTVVIEKDLNTRETAELVKVFSAHKVIIETEEKKPKKPEKGEPTVETKSSEGAVTVPEATQPPAPPKPAEAKPPTPNLEQLRAIAEDIKAKRLQQKYDKAGQIYILLANYYPQSMIDFFTDHVELEKTTPEKAVALMKDVVDEMYNRLTHYDRKREVMNEIFQSLIKWGK